MAIASTMMPMPPTQLSSWRQRLIDGGSLSSPDSTVAPVVVSPDMVSKYASVNDRSSIASISGRVAMPAISTQASVTSRKPSRGFSSRLCRRVPNQRMNPMAKEIDIASMKSIRVPSS